MNCSSSGCSEDRQIGGIRLRGLFEPPPGLRGQVAEHIGRHKQPFEPSPGQPPEPDPEPELLGYAEALQIYNQELLALDRLKAERDKLQQSLEPDASELVAGLLEQTGEARAEVGQALEDLGIPSESATTWR